jgi:hypothetical protein
VSTKTLSGRGGRSPTKQVMSYNQKDKYNWPGFNVIKLSGVLHSEINGAMRLKVL